MMIFSGETFLISSCLLFLLASPGFSIPKDQFYPFGAKHGDSSLPEGIEDVSSAEIRLKTPIKFFTREYSGIYVSIT
jgi:hypothetical protein